MSINPFIPDNLPNLFTETLHHATLHYEELLRAIRGTRHAETSRLQKQIREALNVISRELERRGAA